MILIDVKNLDFSYGTGELRRQVLRNVNLQLNEGEIVILTGPSGSGKTTLLTIIGGLRHATEGSVTVMGEQMIKSNEATKVRVRQNTGYIFQQHNLLKSLTALQNVCMALEPDDTVSGSERIKRAKDMLSAVGLSDKFHSLPDQLSGGQRQRVSIARALMTNPKMVLADEPTASLDKNSGQEAVAILKTLASEFGSTILLVTHDYRILDVAERVITLEDGEIKDQKIA
jgi:putative ABC transport system ATP-binding protein